VSDLRPIRDDVRRLGRVPEVDPQVIEARRVWHEAVGGQVAANSLPVRRSGDTLIVHCASSGWASELTLLERQMRSRLESLMDPPPTRLRFEVGDVDAPETVVSTHRAAPAIEPSDDQRARARELAADIRDPVLRRAAARAIAAGLARDS
jgi:Dna[CI] antecedent, DciA